jgi:hypothetical protein
LIRTPFSRCEYRRDLTCMSSKTQSHDVVCGFREAKMESSGAEGGISPRRFKGFFLKNKTEWLLSFKHLHYTNRFTLFTTYQGLPHRLTVFADNFMVPGNLSTIFHDTHTPVTWFNECLNINHTFIESPRKALGKSSLFRPCPFSCI